MIITNKQTELTFGVNDDCVPNFSIVQIYKKYLFCPIVYLVRVAYNVKASEAYSEQCTLTTSLIVN